jgi:hypothetical protein
MFWLPPFEKLTECAAGSSPFQHGFPFGSGDTISPSVLEIRFMPLMRRYHPD